MRHLLKGIVDILFYSSVQENKRTKIQGIFSEQNLQEAGKGGPAARPYGAAIECLIQPS
jgi:heat shock protein HspQ